MSSATLRDRTQQLVSELNKTMTYKEIAEAAGLTEGWVEAFAQGKSKDPGVVKVETLYVFITKSKLVLA